MCCHQTDEWYSYYITASFIPCNTDSYYSVITITMYQTYPKFASITSNEPTLGLGLIAQYMSLTGLMISMIMIMIF